METNINTISTIEKQTLKATDIATIFNNALRKREHVIQFGQSIPNPNLAYYNRPDIIDTLYILFDIYDNYDCSKVYDLTGFDMYALDIESIFDVKEVAHDNTYNWSAPITNDLDYKVYTNRITKKGFIEVNVHNGYGDVRGGYNIAFLFEFTDLLYVDSFGLANILMDTGNNYHSRFTITGLDEIEVGFTFDMFNEAGTFNVYAPMIDHEDYDVYIGDYQDCITYANKTIQGFLDSLV